MPDDKGFVNSAGTAGPIRTRDGSFDAPERQNDDGASHVARALAQTPLDPKFGPFRVHVSKGYPNMHNLGVQKLGGKILFFICYFWIFLNFVFFIIRPKMLKMAFWKILNFDPHNFWTP